MRASIILGSYLVAVVIFQGIEPGRAQTKIESALPGTIQEKGVARVLIVTRADPDAPGGGQSVASTSSYVTTVLGAAASNVQPVGRLPVVSAEITADALNKLNEDPNVVLVTRDLPAPATLMDSVPLVGGDKVHKMGFVGTNYSVAVLDTGMQKDHPALSGSVIAEACFSTPQSAEYKKVASLCPHGLDVSLVAGSAGSCPPEVYQPPVQPRVQRDLLGHYRSRQPLKPPVAVLL